MIYNVRKNLHDFLTEANQAVKQVSAAEAVKLIDNKDTVFVDVRETSETERGIIPKAVHAPRGMLEFHIDPKGPAHKEVFSQEKSFIFYCGSGGRSALAGATAKQMGLNNVSHIQGGFPAWISAGGPVGAKA